MPRPGGNPELKEYCFQKPEGVKEARNSLFAIRIESEIVDSLKKIDKDKIRNNLIEFLLKEGYEVSENIIDYYKQL